jgi:hypothetical protein
MEDFFMRKSNWMLLLTAALAILILGMGAAIQPAAAFFGGLTQTLEDGGDFGATVEPEPVDQPESPASGTEGISFAQTDEAAGNAADPPRIVTSGSPLKSGTLGTAYTETIAVDSLATGFRVQSGELPPGLSISGNGVISGTPLAEGVYHFSLVASNADGDSAPAAFSIETVTRGVDAVREMYGQLPNTALDWEKVTRYAEAPALTAPYAAGSLNAEDMADALNTLKFLRYLAGVPYEDVIFIAELNDSAQHKAVLMAASNQFGHYPNKPADMDEAFFDLAQSARAESIAYGISNISEVVDGFITDGGDHNLESAGHRMMLLAPGIQEFGIGYAQKQRDDYAVIHSDSRRNLTPYSAMWPGPGAFPIQYFTKSENAGIVPLYPWSISLSQAYQPPGRDKITLKLTRQRDGKAWVFDASTPQLSADYAPESSMHLSVSNGSIIFRPDATSLGPILDGDLFTVDLSGIEKQDGTWANLNYEIHFFDLFGEQRRSHHIIAAAGPGGLAEGGGDYEDGASVTLTAMPQAGYVFDGWYENNVKITGAGAVYSFIAVSGRTLEARFTVSAPAVPSTPLIPSKVQIQTTNQGALQFDYELVLPGAVNRELFFNAIMNKTAGTPVLILSGAAWYNVDSMTLRDAVDANRVAEAFPDFKAVLENGLIVTSAAARLIDDINRSYPLDDLAKVQILYEQYIALTDGERAVLENNVSVTDLIEAYNELPRVLRMGRELREEIYESAGN